MTTSQYVRLRADPEILRVSIRREWDEKEWIRWVVTISVRGTAFTIKGFGSTAQAAVYDALQLAEATGLPGLNLGLGSACQHPQWKEGA